MIEGKRPISYDDFFAAVRCCDCRTESRSKRPSEGEAAYKYGCQLQDLVQLAVYPPWFVNEERTDSRSVNDPEARAIRVEELAALDSIVGTELDKWSMDNPWACTIAETSVIVLHCAGCDRRVLIDGMHRILWLLKQGKTESVVHVVELSGSVWPVGTPDLNVVCTCPRCKR